MDKFLSGGINELKQAKTAITRANSLNEEMIESEKLLKANDKDVESQKKYMNDKIESAVKSRREELEKYHDDKIAEAKKELKAIEKDRKVAKTKAVNSRISGETGSYSAENKKLKSQIRSIFKQAKIPAFFNNALYFALFQPKTVKDFIILAIFVLLAVAVIPNVVCLLLKVSTVAKVFIYIGIVLIFILIYFAIFFSNRSAGKNAAFEKVRAIRKRIKNNNKQIKITSDSIRTDTDESIYGLEEYDENIDKITLEIEAKEDAKAAALKDFEENTSASIRREIENENIPVIHQLEADGKALKADFAQKEAAAKAALDDITNTYSTYLGAKNATPDKIDEMITLIEEGQAQTVMQALDIINGEIKNV